MNKKYSLVVNIVRGSNFFNLIFKFDTYTDAADVIGLFETHYDTDLYESISYKITSAED